jgi:hypothetical protein
MEKSNLMESVQPCSGQYSMKADLRLNAWLAVAGVVWVADLELLKRYSEWSPLLRGVLALAPLVPGLLYVRSCMRFVRGLDELQRRIQLDALIFAAMGTVIAGMAINTLNAHAVPMGALKHGLGIGQSFVLMVALWIVGSATANRRYK